MIDVLKRLAELDADNPNVAQPTMQAEQSLGTITNISESVNECGGMMGMSHTPASFSINASAESGDEVANMLQQIMGLAGVQRSGDIEVPAADKEIELSEPHGVELDGGNDDMADMISMIDRMNGPEEKGSDNQPEDEGLGGALAGGAIGALAGGPLGALQGAAAGDSLTDPDEKESQGEFTNQDGQQSPIADMADEVEDMAAELADLNSEENETYDNSPNEKVKSHDYGDTQVTPKPQGFKQRVGDNPYKQIGESVDEVTLSLLKAYQEFKAQQ